MSVRIKVVFLLAALALSGCVSMTSPVAKDECRSGYINSGGEYVCTDPGSGP